MLTLVEEGSVVVSDFSGVNIETAFFFDFPVSCVAESRTLEVDKEGFCEGVSFTLVFLSAEVSEDSVTSFDEE